MGMQDHSGAEKMTQGSEGAHSSSKAVRCDSGIDRERQSVLSVEGEVGFPSVLKTIPRSQDFTI